MNPINFTGTTFCTPIVEAQTQVNKSEFYAIDNYADRYDADVFVYNREGKTKGRYDAIISKGNQIYHKVFDFKNPKLSALRHIQISNLANEKAVFGIK